MAQHAEGEGVGGGGGTSAGLRHQIWQSSRWGIINKCLIEKMSGPREREVMEGLKSFSPKASLSKQLPYHPLLRLLLQPLPHPELQSSPHFLHPKTPQPHPETKTALTRRKNIFGEG